MIYNVIGLMSGSSLDGLDVAFVSLNEQRGIWNFNILAAKCYPYSDEWVFALNRADSMSVPDFLKLNERYGRYMGELVNDFITEHGLEHKVHLITSHGHTVYHDPGHGISFQLGNGATISAVTGLPVISDLRSADVALGGQGAPIVPIGDALLFANYDFLLNIGGIANITIHQNGLRSAFDICAANQVLNILAGYEGLAMDEDGRLARSGQLLSQVLDELATEMFYSQTGPKSLSNLQAKEMVFPHLMESRHATVDLLHTYCHHIVDQVFNAIPESQYPYTPTRMLVTGGGAFNKYLIELLSSRMLAKEITVVVPEDNIVKYKEATVMALIGVLRWRGEENVLSSATGAKRNSTGGALWSV